ncbi:dicarboxylate/amino acid:cation symporter [Geomicrobium sp. JCM 19039]|uniref:dicarboxylate/amino acid:cation symporter n=1 Tax=Geomicrobium sp. JCM 19039 TaxID=1460636 RepID=UPI00045F4231|nr:dicarboxylate/amino acid:cation symporter [Geomicrobium sp. JCM 19039]GAK13178.1 proton/glutamate symport protein [Geomicrobium sp. JCM 19039]
MSLTKKIIIALIAGLVVGLSLNAFLSEDAFSNIDYYVLSPIGDIFLRAISMLVVPLVFFSLVLGAASMSDVKKLGRIGGFTMGFYLLTTPIALGIGIGVAYLLQPGTEGLMQQDMEGYEPNEAPPVMETLINIIPSNPVEALASGEMLQIIVFALLIGFGIAMLGEKTKGLLDLARQANDVMIWLVKIVMLLAPFGAFALIASAIGELGWNALESMFMYMLAIVLALFIQMLVVYGGIVFFWGKKSPLWFFKGFMPAMAVAFSTSSSSATLPVTMKSAEENLGVPKQISSFTLPLGATINMDGTAIMQAVATIFLAQVYAVDLGATELLTIILTATLASLGTASVPGAGIIMLAMVLQSVGIPLDGIALILAVDRILDMTRTAVNITGDAAASVVITKMEKNRGETFDEEKA